MVESVAYIVNGVQCYLGYSLRRSWSADHYSVSVVFSLVCSCQWGSESIAFSVCSVQGTCTCVLFSGSFSVCTLHCLQCSEHWLFTKNLSCSESTLWRSSAPAQFLNFNIPSTTDGHLRTKYNAIFNYFLSTYLSMHNDTRFGTYLFLVGTHWGNLLVNSRFSTGDLNFCVRSIPLWEPCVEKRAVLRAPMHRPIGGAL